MPTENRRVAAYLPKEIDDRLKAFITDRDLKGDSPALVTILSEYFGVSYQVAHQVSHSDDFVSRQEFEALSTKIDESLKVDYLSTHSVAHFDDFASKGDLDDVATKLSELQDVLLGELKNNQSQVDALEARLELLESLITKDPVSSVKLIPRPKEDKSKQELWTTGKLAKRLGMNQTTLSHWKGKDSKRNKAPDELLKVTRSKDPDGIGWVFDDEAKVFKPERELPSNTPDKVTGGSLFENF